MPSDCTECYASEITAGKLFCDQGHEWPIVDGIPRFIPESLARDFKKTQETFSFEWKMFRFGERNWGQDIETRKGLFLKGMNVSVEQLKGKTILDAGCGSGLLSMEMAKSLGMEVFALDLAYGIENAYRHNDSPNVHFYQEFTLRSHGVRRAGSAAQDLAYVACGRLEAFWEFKLNPWDTAAGILLVEEAGGRVTDFSGGPFRLDSQEILASNGLIHAELVALFSDMFAGRDLAPIPTPQEFAQHRAERGAAAG